MSRALRIEYDGAWYHVMNRGQERRSIFRGDGDKKAFLKLLNEISEIYSVEIHAFSLMDNHYHLLIHTPVAGLSRAMRHLNGLYTQGFNKIHRKDGPLFRGRYKAILVDSNEYLTELVRYIHLNPVEAKLCEHPKQHKWTSYRYYFKPDKTIRFLRTESILAEFGKNEKKALEYFEVFTMAKSAKNKKKEIENTTNNILGGKGFKEWVSRNFIEEKHKKTKEIPERDKRLLPELTAKEIIQKVAFIYNVSLKDLRSSQSGQRNEAKAVTIYLLRHKKGMKLKEIGRWLNTTNEVAVAQTIYRTKKKLEKDRKFKKIYREIEKSIF